MSVFINISFDGSEKSLPWKIQKLILLREQFSIPDTIYFPKSALANLSDIIKNYEKYIGSDMFIVRSAHQDEDGITQSYAGMYHSIPGYYTPENLEKALLSVWATLGGEDFLFVQTYIQADISWIFFSDIWAWNKLIECIAWGNSLLTQWSELWSSILLDSDFHPIERTFRFQKTIQVGPTQVQEYRSYFSLSQDREVYIRDTLKELQTIESWPSDIEWCISWGNFYILQIRPITASFSQSEQKMALLHKNEMLETFMNSLKDVKHLFEILWFSSEDIIFDLGGGLLCSGIFSDQKWQETTLWMIQAEKLYILLRETSWVFHTVFYENERHELRFQGSNLAEKWNKLLMALPYHITIARLPEEEHLSIFWYAWFGGILLLKSRLSFARLLSIKNTSEWIASKELTNTIEYEFASNLAYINDTEVFRVTKDIREADGGANVYVGFDIAGYDIHPNIALILLERRSQLSHGAILARELKIPCIYGVAGITKKLRAWQFLRIQKTENLIIIIDNL